MITQWFPFLPSGQLSLPLSVTIQTLSLDDYNCVSPTEDRFSDFPGFEVGREDSLINALIDAKIPIVQLYSFMFNFCQHILKAFVSLPIRCTTRSCGFFM